MKKINLLILTLTALILFNCSSSENEELTENFLQKFDKTVWKHTDQNDFTRFYIFNNEENKPVTTLSDLNFNNNCYYLGDSFGQLNSATYGNELSLTIKENEIEIFSNYGDNENYTDTFTISGDNIIHKHIESYFNDVNESERILIRTNLTESDLSPICP